MAKEYKLKEGSIHEQFLASRAKIQLFGGGYGNGKTSVMCLKALQLAKDYPGMNALMARSTYPKLNDTLRRTFIDFCPEDWVASFPQSKNSENSCTLNNASKFNFRYIAQKKATEDGGSTSNLLSATYDLAVIDQIEDPEISYKDFLDILGRMRGDTVYRGDDPTMPRTGPRWIFLSCNPTRNWVFKRIVWPLKKYQEDGTVMDDLLCVRDDKGYPVLGEDGKPQLLIELFEGPTYDNSHVLAPDFIQTLESLYKGQMRDRFLKGEWVAYEGLVYPDYNSAMHQVRHDRMFQYRNSLLNKGVDVKYLESYDFGIASPSCYLLAFIDHHGNVHVIDGFYEKEMSIEAQSQKIRELRNIYGVKNGFILADPSIFRRASGDKMTVGKSVAELFNETGGSKLFFTRGNNDILNGIVKVRNYLTPHAYHLSPYDGSVNAPHIYFSKQLTFLDEEFSAYFWEVDNSGDRTDKPTDRNDHAMDALKYLLSNRPNVADIKPHSDNIPEYMRAWTEVDQHERSHAHRYK